MGISQETKEAIADNLARAIQRGAECHAPKTHWRFNARYLNVGLIVEYAFEPDDPEEHGWVAL